MRISSIQLSADGLLQFLFVGCIVLTTAQVCFCQQPKDEKKRYLGFLVGYSTAAISGNEVQHYQSTGAQLKPANASVAGLVYKRYWSQKLMYTTGLSLRPKAESLLIAFTKKRRTKR